MLQLRGMYMAVLLPRITYVRMLSVTVIAVLPRYTAIASYIGVPLALDHTIKLSSFILLIIIIYYTQSGTYVRGGYGFKDAENEVQRTMESIRYKALYIPNRQSL